ncbi:MAG: cytochrome b6f subunit family protein [Cyanobacteria bacterium J06642_2]
MFNVGDKVRVKKLIDVAQGDVSDHVGKEGILRAFRVVDGSGIGCLVDFGDDEESVWFFEKELTAV